MHLKFKKYRLMLFIFFFLLLIPFSIAGNERAVYPQGRLATNPETGEYYIIRPDNSVLNQEANTNELYPKTNNSTPQQNVPQYYPQGQSGNSAINPGTGDYYFKMGDGVINPKTGEYYPNIGPLYLAPGTEGETEKK